MLSAAVKVPDAVLGCQLSLYHLNGRDIPISLGKMVIVVAFARSKDQTRISTPHGPGRPNQARREGEDE